MRQPQQPASTQLDQPPGVGRRVFGVLFLGGALLAAGLVALTSRPEETVAEAPPTGPSGPPDRAAVVCAEGGTEPQTPVARPRPDGVHVVVDNAAGEGVFSIRDAEEAGRRHAETLGRTGTTEILTTFPPGSLLVGCFSSEEEIPADADTTEYARIEIVDPMRLWTSDQLDCLERERSVHRGGTVEVDPPPSYEAIVREVVPGVLDSDELSRPGYPGTRWLLERWIVIRDLRAVADLSVRPGRHRFIVAAEACPGTEIGGGDAATPPSA